jgi:hypothetical protein
MVVAASYDFLPAVALYAANLILLAATAILIIRVVERDTGRRVVRDARFELAVLIVSALLSVAIAAFDPGSAMVAYLLNLFPPLLRHLFRSGKG